MIDWPTFPPKPGLTKEEQKKVKAYIKKHGVTTCPAMGSPELAEMEIKKHLKWLAGLCEQTKREMGFIPLKEKPSPEVKREKHNAYHREYRQLHLEKLRKYNRKKEVE